MKEIEHVLKRVRVLDKEGEFKRLSERQFAVARAIAERTVDGDRGCQLAIQQVAIGAFKERSTVKTALRELVSLGVLNRCKPGPGPYETHIFRFAQAILSAAGKAKPHDARPGREIFITGVAVDGGGTLINSEPKTMMKTSKTDGQLLAGQKLAGNCNGLTHPPFPDPSPKEIKTDPASCSPALQGGMCNSIEEDKASKDDLKRFFDFLKFFNFSSFETFCMRRLKGGGRGGTFMKREINSYENLEHAVGWAREQAVEIVMLKKGLLLVDDVKPEFLEKAKKSGLAFTAVETSERNYQLLFAGDQSWNDQQIKTAQTLLVLKFLGDRGSIGSTHLHRLPGSINYKSAGRFVTRLFFQQRGDLVRLPITRVVSAAATNPANPVAVNVATRKAHQEKDTSNSSADFVEAFRLIRARKTYEQVKAAMLASATQPARNGKHGDGVDYAERTTAAAFREFKHRPRSHVGSKLEVTEVTLKT